jgi:hypothetical protein
MDKRRDPRFQADQPVVVTVLSDPQIRMDARVKDASGRGLGLVTPAPVVPGAAIRIELDDTIVLGEAIYCRDEPDGYFIGVELDQVLVGLTELSRNLAAFAPEFAVEARRP